VARVGTVERLVAEREVGDDVSLDGGLEERPLEPAGVAGMHPGQPAVLAESHAHEHVATERLDQRRAFACPEQRRYAQDRPRRQPVEQPVDDSEAFDDLVHAQQQPRVDIAGGARLEVEGHLVVRRIGKRLARVEGTA